VLAGTQRLPRLISPGAAFELLLPGGRVDAYRAPSVGLVNHALEPEALMAAAPDLAGLTASRSPAAWRSVKCQMRFRLQDDFLNALEIYAAEFAGCFGTFDQRERVAKFIAKRPAASFKAADPTPAAAPQPPTRHQKANSAEPAHRPADSVTHLPPRGGFCAKHPPTGGFCYTPSTEARILCQTSADRRILLHTFRREVDFVRMDLRLRWSNSHAESSGVYDPPLDDPWRPNWHKIRHSTQSGNRIRHSPASQPQTNAERRILLLPFHRQADYVTPIRRLADSVPNTRRKTDLATFLRRLQRRPPTGATAA
jgi:hypothetical protein